MAGRPTKEYDAKTFVDLVGLGCDQKEICWFFRDEKGKPANVDTLSRWCVRTFGMNFQEFYSENGGMAMKIKLRRNQMKLSEKSAAMAIFLGKNYLNQRETPNDGEVGETLKRALDILGVYQVPLTQESNYTVYKHTNRINGKVYIGIARCNISRYLTGAREDRTGRRWSYCL